MATRSRSAASSTTRTFGGADDGFNARINRANKAKELGKYPIDYLGSTDAGGQYRQGPVHSQSLVERDQVFAIAPVISTGCQQSAGTYAAGKKVPYFGGGFTNAFCSPNTYGMSSSAVRSAPIRVHDRGRTVAGQSTR